MHIVITYIMYCKVKQLKQFSSYNQFGTMLQYCKYPIILWGYLLNMRCPHYIPILRLEILKQVFFLSPQ